MKLRDLLLIAGGVAATSQVSALSLGNNQGNVQLGSPIDLVFQVQADAGQTAQSSCIVADVWMGDTAIDRSQILVTAQDRRVRVQTTMPVDEPLITLKLNAGCDASISRSYTFFADPPKALAASVDPIDLSKIQIAPLLAMPSAKATAGQPAPAARTAKRKVNRQTPPPSPAPKSSPATDQTKTDAPAMEPAAPVLASAAAADSTKPRLRMEPLEGLANPESLASPAAGITTADSAPLTAPVHAADAEAQLQIDINAARLEAMEQQLQAMHKQLSSNQTEISGLHNQLTQAQRDSGLPAWVYVLLGMLALALASIAWLVQRLKQERVNTQLAWADTVLAAEASERSAGADTGVKHPPSDLAPVTTSATDATENAKNPAPLSDTTIKSPAPRAPLSPTSATLATPPSQHALGTAFAPSSSAASLPEVLTAQALFDVQEQAEFYASIGENNQAIDILQSHIAKHEASSPLAYIELLQLLYRLSRTEAFEKVREKFQSHFNVQVPTFLDFSRKGHDLWSGHPEVLKEIEAQWPTDDVQALLRNLIVRKHPKDDVSSEIRFELSAFDDLLMLYNVAKTTPAASRGDLPGRTRTVPTDIPLPEIVVDHTPPAVASGSMPLQDKDAPLDFDLDLLSALPTPAPLTPPKPHTNAPFQTPSRFSPDEALTDGLSLDWSMPAAADKTATPESDLTLEKFDEELQIPPLDDRDLPADRSK